MSLESAHKKISHTQNHTILKDQLEKYKQRSSYLQKQVDLYEEKMREYDKRIEVMTERALSKRW
jgi:hypothetical protein